MGGVAAMTSGQPDGPVHGDQRTINRGKEGARDAEQTVTGKGTISLQREVGLFGATALLVGSVIGSGIFVTPARVYKDAGSIGLDLVIWTVAGLLTLIAPLSNLVYRPDWSLSAFSVSYADLDNSAGGLCYVELGCLLPASGGDYAYMCAVGKTIPRRGDVGAFLAVWAGVTVIDPVGSAVQGLAFSAYVLRAVYTDCDPPYLVVILLANVFITLTTYINCFSAKISANVQSILSSIKCLVLVSIISTAAVLARKGNHLQDVPVFADTARDPGRITAAIYGALFSYSGWKSINCVAAELRDPQRLLPRAITVGIVLVTVIYLLTNLAYFLCLEGEEIISSEAVAASFAIATWGSSAALLVPFFVAVSSFGTASATAFTYSRVVLAAARQGHLPRFLSYVHAGSAIPLASTLARCVLAMLFTLVGSVRAITEAYVFMDSLLDLLSVACLLALRRTMRDAPRSYRVPLVLIAIRLLMSVVLLVIPFVGPQRYAPYVVVAAALLAGVVYYWLFVIRRLDLPGSRAFNVFVQKLLCSAPCTDELEAILALNKSL